MPLTIEEEISQIKKRLDFIESLMTPETRQLSPSYTPDYCPVGGEHIYIAETLVATNGTSHAKCGKCGYRP